MNRSLVGVAILGLSVLAGGCGGSVPAVARDLGTVDYPSAFATARDVLSQYFTLDQENADLGLLTSLPKPIHQPPDRLLTTPGRGREKARLRLVRDGQNVAAYLTIFVERQQGAPARRFETSRENYSSVPNQTPAETGAADTPEQNEAWTLDRYDTTLAHTILRDLYDRLHPAATQPTGGN